MSGLAMGWLSREEMVALGWTLLHFCWQGTAVAVAYAVVDRLTSRATATVRYAVALGALALMPLVVVATFAIEMQVATPQQSGATVVYVTTDMREPVLNAPLAREIPLALAPMLEERGAWLASQADRVLPWVDGLWILGVLLLAVRAMGGWWQLEQVRRRARRLIPAEVQRGFQRMCERVNVGRQVVLQISDEVISPLAMGVWRATVILPLSAVLRLPSEELESVLAHELGHIRRLDYLCNLLQTAVESVLFFHPAVWRLSQTVRERREICCDEIAVQSCDDALVYARALLRLEEQKSVELRLAVALEGCSGSLLGRVKQVLGESVTMETGTTSGVRIAAAGAVVMALLLGPKMSKAVTTPVMPASQPVVTYLSTVSKPRAAHIATELCVPSKTKTTTVNVQPAPVATPAIETDVELASNESLPTPRSTSMAIPRVEIAPAALGEVRPRPMASVKMNGHLMMVSELQTAHGTAYLDAMREAGYPLDLNNDLNCLISLKSVGVTPEYAKSMAQIGLGKPTVHDLISLKALGVTPEYVEGLKHSGLAPKDFHEVQTEKALGVTPEYAAAMKQTGFGDLNLHELISLKAQGMTPEYAGWLKQQFPQAGTDELRRAAVFHVNDKFIAQAKSHGIDGKDLDKLLRLKMSGLLDE